MDKDVQGGEVRLRLIRRGEHIEATSTTTQDQMVTWARNYFAASGFFILEGNAGVLDILFDLFYRGGPFAAYRWNESNTNARALRVAHGPYTLFVEGDEASLRNEVARLLACDRSPHVSHLPCSIPLRVALSIFDERLRARRAFYGLNPLESMEHDYVRLVFLTILTTN